ncbi:Low affinity Fe/Cu permease [Phyllobacterium sp. CL33Tsu]|uniref:low affinity iron permease family protein n=1 Tax=Phyllobacterium sp. CL33Tsu TaxID=1798191 RepID=UPI0008EC8BBE|nr:low affinity iron permease family protein [Phyllobacterium sp. CL33Tsu]SFI82096.1 Low affinity Fe/Cu permease [Phyllobacterium sp. CL33Tsu]
MFGKLFNTIANKVAFAAGKPVTFILCCVVVVVWGISGPIFGFSDTWQLIINTGTTIITFLMVFLIQNTQNRDGIAIQAKLDELVRVTEAKNAFIGIEHLTEDEVEKFRRQCEAAAKKADKELEELKKTQAQKRSQGKTAAKPATGRARTSRSAAAAR